MCMTFLFPNRLKVIPLTSFVGIMSQREGVISSTSNFSTPSNFGFKSRARLGNWFTVSGCPLGLPLEKNLSRPGMHPIVLELGLGFGLGFGFGFAFGLGLGFRLWLRLRIRVKNSG